MNAPSQSAPQPVTIDRRIARRFLLAYQGLGGGPPSSGPADPAAAVMDYLHRVGSIQFDPLNIAGRNPELVLQARVPGFTPEVLHSLLYRQRRLIDGWDKMMCIYPVEDWPNFRPLRQAALHKYRSSRRGQPALEAFPKVRSELETRGPLSSADIDLDHTVDWSWAPTRLSRAALEAMFHTGEVIVHRKEGNRKIYDLARRHLPTEYFEAPAPHPASSHPHASDHAPFSSEEEYSDWRILRRISSVGLLWGRAGDAWLDTGKSAVRSAALQRLQARGEIHSLQVDGIPSRFFIPATALPLLEQVTRKLRTKDGDSQAPAHATIIAPLDNLMWDRTLVEQLFGFRYRWEVYKPAAQREFGYYVLPVLYGDRFIARFEPGRNKSTGSLLIKNWWWEPDFQPGAAAIEALLGCFRRFCSFLGTETVEISDQAAAEVPFIADAATGQ